MASPRVSLSKLDPLLQASREPVFWVSGDRKLLGVNRAWETLTGLPSANVIGLDCRAIGLEVAEVAVSVVASFHVPQEALDGRAVSSQVLVRLVSGDEVWKRIDFAPLHHSQGALAAVVGFVRDDASSSGLPVANSDRLRIELLKLREGLLGRPGLDLLIGKGDAHRRLLDQIETAASSAAPVLIIGEAGTGKRLVAQIIHQLSKDSSDAKISLDCEALPPDVLERALFGISEVEDSSTESRRFAFPEHATLVLENVLSLPRDLQRRIAIANEPVVRCIATTSSDPEAAFREDRFRSDLYYRLTTLVIRLQPLRDRLAELPLLAQAFLERANSRSKKTRTGFTDETIKALLGYDWPGNLQELSRVVEAAAERALGDQIEYCDLPAAILGHFASAHVPTAAIAPVPLATLDERLEQVERRLIENALSRFRQNKSRAAESLGISRPRLHRRIKELNLSDEADPSDA